MSRIVLIHLKLDITRITHICSVFSYDKLERSLANQGSNVYNAAFFSSHSLGSYRIEYPPHTLTNRLSLVLCMALEDVTIEHGLPNLAGLQNDVRLAKTICVVDKLGYRVQRVSLNHFLSRSVKNFEAISRYVDGNLVLFCYCQLQLAFNLFLFNIVYQLCLCIPAFGVEPSDLKHAANVEQLEVNSLVKDAILFGQVF